MVEVIRQLNISPWQDPTLWVAHRIARGRTYFGPLSLLLSYMLGRIDAGRLLYVTFTLQSEGRPIRDYFRKIHASQRTSEL